MRVLQGAQTFWIGQVRVRASVLDNALACGFANSGPFLSRLRHGHRRFLGAWRRQVRT